jgi:lysophospholipid acyltransferase (LPLAT)-like uncharacterized protein
MESAEAPTMAEDREGTRHSFRERLKLRIVSSLGYWAIRVIGSTLRWQVEDWENYESIHASGKRIVAAFWHGRLFAAGYYFRNRGFVVMISRNRDGEYVAHISRRLGYGAARGSSSRGSRGAIVEMLRALKRREDVAFTLDGPRGPRYVAKPGAAYLAWKSGNPLMPFSISLEKKWILGSWDHFQIPKPFSRAVVMIAPPIHIPPQATEEEISHAEEELQRALIELRDRGDTRWGGEPDR